MINDIFITKKKILQQAYHAATVIRQMQRMALNSGGSSGRSCSSNSNNATNDANDANAQQSSCVNGGPNNNK